MSFYYSINTESPDIREAFELGRQAVHQASKYGRVTVLWNGTEEAPWRKRADMGRSSAPSSIHSSSCCCCIGFGGNGKEGIVLLIIGVALSFFVGMYYTFKSLRKAVEFGELEQDALNKRNAIQLSIHQLKTTAPSENPEFTESKNAQFPSFQPPAYEDLATSPPPYTAVIGEAPAFIQVNEEEEKFDPNTAKNKVLENSAKLFASVKHERQIAFVSQALMTLGAGCLTAALVVVLVTEPHFVFIALGSTGAGLVIVGATTYGLKHALLTWKREKNLAEEISALLLQLKQENYWDVGVTTF